MPPPSSGGGTASASAPALPTLAARLLIEGLTAPVAFVQHPTLPDAQLIAQQDGRIRIVKSGALLEQDFLDLSGRTVMSGEQGLLGLAFAPNAATTGRFFVNLTDHQGNTVVARYRLDPNNPLRADQSSGFDLVWPGGQAAISQPYQNHNGGHLAFGPDGHLYIGLGDGGSANDPAHLAQNPGSLLGKMLRIDVAVPDTDPEGYDVPSDNPFVGHAGVLPEIWALGFRNPWRYSFDDWTLGGTGALVIGDVGQERREEINYEPLGRGGRNYGWRNREGTLDHVSDQPAATAVLTDPLFEYDRTRGQAVTGGLVYRGTLLGRSFVGRYLFADAASGRLWSLGLSIDAQGNARVVDEQEHVQLWAGPTQPVSFGVDARGEIYVLSHTGAIYMLTLTSAARPCASPELIVAQEPSCVSNREATIPSPRVIGVPTIKSPIIAAPIIRTGTPGRPGGGGGE